MAKTAHYYVQFDSDCYYHIYNRTVDKKPMFRSEGNCVYFMNQYQKYLSEVVTTYSYALCGNHFHFGVKINPIKDLGAFSSVHSLVSHQFRLFFLSYAKAFNKERNRVGTLFQTPFKRCPVNSEEKLIRLIFYHHANPQRHRLCDDFRQYRWTSYQEYLKGEMCILPISEVYALMGGKQKFVEYHRQLHLARRMRKNGSLRIEELLGAP